MHRFALKVATLPEGPPRRSSRRVLSHHLKGKNLVTKVGEKIKRDKFGDKIGRKNSRGTKLVTKGGCKNWRAKQIGDKLGCKNWRTKNLVTNRGAKN